MHQDQEKQSVPAHFYWDMTDRISKKNVG